jgi:hypothetical protein
VWGGVSLAPGSDNMRIRLIQKISPILFANDKLDEKAKIAMVLFVATCSELELRIWENIVDNRALPTAFPELNRLFCSDWEDCGKAMRMELYWEEMQEKILKLKDRIEKKLQTIGIKAEDLKDDFEEDSEEDFE